MQHAPQFYSHSWAPKFTQNHWVLISQYQKWLDNILAHSQNPNTQPHLLTHIRKSHLWSPVSKIYHIFGEISNVLHFPLLGLCQSPCLAGLLTLTPRLVVTSHSLITPNHIYHSWWCHFKIASEMFNARPICLRFGRWLEMYPYLTMIMWFECCI